MVPDGHGVHVSGGVDGVGWCQMVSDGVRRVSDGVRWCPMGVRGCQLVSDGVTWLTVG